MEKDTFTVQGDLSTIFSPKIPLSLNGQNASTFNKQNVQPPHVSIEEWS